MQGTADLINRNSHLSEDCGEPGVADLGAAPGQEGHVRHAVNAGHGKSLCTRRTVTATTRDPNATGLKGETMQHTTHKKLIQSISERIIQTSDGGPTTEANASIR